MSLQNRPFPQRGAVVKIRWKREEFERPRNWHKPIDVDDDRSATEKVAAPPLAENR
jgi:two-component system, sensor histidine kinase RegB